MKIEIWSDFVCPWCYIGKRRFEKALARFDGANEVEVVWRSFQLHPDQPKGARQRLAEAIAAKMGSTVEQVRAMNAQITELAAAEGLAYDFDRYTLVNTFDAHRLAHLAASLGLGLELHERLLRAQLVEGEVLEDPETLIRLAAEVGVPEAASRRVLESDAYARDVEADIRELVGLGGSGVPFFVIDRAIGVSGAQPVEVFLRALDTTRDREAQPAAAAR